MTTNKSYTYILLICGLAGMLMSFMLTIDKFTLLMHPEAELPCNINPIISCGSVIGTPQASAFGFPNPLLGLAGFAGIFTIGLLALLGSASLDKKVLNLLLAGSTLAILFIHYLFYQSVFVIGALCLYCMITWFFTWLLFIYTLKARFPNSTFLIKNHLAILIAWYLAITLIILNHFRDFFFG